MLGEATTKKILHVGKGELHDFPKGTKATFHFRTVKRSEDDEEVIIDDSRKAGKPMELLLGKQFKMPVLEEFIKTMRVGEVSHFSAIRSLVANYPFISKAYRRFANSSKHEHNEDDKEAGSGGHCCGMSLQKQGLGHEDLDELLQKPPAKLEFTIELLKADSPEDYEKEAWEMEHEERLSAIPRLKEEGNFLYKEGKASEAAEKYGKALGILEQLLLREKPGDEDWLVLDRLKVPLYSNYAQCKMVMKDYYAVIEHSSEVLKREPDNVKSLFRRAKAHALVWSTKEARVDFERVRDLDPSLEKTVLNEIKSLETTEREKDIEDKLKYCKMF